METIVNDFLNMLLEASDINSDRDHLDWDRIRFNDEITSFDNLFDQINGNGPRMNFFPSNKKGGCHEIAMFVSFHKQFKNLKFKKDQMVSLDEVIKKLVQQVLGTCYPTNRKIILLTDKVDTEVFEPWLGNLQAIKTMGMEIEIVYLRSNGSTEFVNPLVGL
jgi:hypothetical protein